MAKPNKALRFTVGKYDGEPAILGPGGPFLYAPSERAQMVATCRDLNAEAQAEAARDGEDF